MRTPFDNHVSEVIAAIDDMADIPRPLEEYVEALESIYRHVAAEMAKVGVEPA